jgi:hypothetical protein
MKSKLFEQGKSVKKDRLSLAATGWGSDFEFNAEVAEVFDDMLARSVPFYREQQQMFKEIGKKFGFQAQMSMTWAVLPPLP